jgi:hypothetical protein
VTAQELVHQTSVWQPEHISGAGIFIPVHVPGSDVQSRFVTGSSTIWHHVDSVFGKRVSHSQTIFRGPLTSQSAPTPVHVNSTLPQGAYVHADKSSVTLRTTGGVIHWAVPGEGPPPINQTTVPPSVYVQLRHPVTSLPHIIQASSFYVGDPVVAIHSGLGIDHIPEPATLALFAIGGFAALMRFRLSRR